jgi:hypothetical protein
MPAENPQWSTLTPFLMTSDSQLADQTQIALFWNDPTG